MDKEINRIKLKKLYSENNMFDPIEFHNGINLILGEKCNIDSTQGRKTTGVGKSLCVDFIDFCLLKDYAGSRIEKVPEDVFPKTENIFLEFSIGISNMLIIRNRQKKDNLKMLCDGKEITFSKIDDARTYLADKLYANVEVSAFPSFRALVSLINRDEKSEFIDILKCHDVTKNIPINLTPHLFLLTIDLAIYNKILNYSTRIKELDLLIKENKKLLTNGNKKVTDVQASFNALNDELSKIEQAVDSFKSEEAFESIQKEILDIENELDKLRVQQCALKLKCSKIENLPKPEMIDDAEIELVYNQFKSDFGASIVKSLQEIIGFKNRVEEFQKMLLTEKLKSLEKEIALISRQINELDTLYAEKIALLDNRGVLKNLKTTLKIFNDKKQQSLKIGHLLNEYDKNTKEKKKIAVEKNQDILSLDNDLELRKDVITDLENTFLTLHERIIGNKEAAFSVETIDKQSRKCPLDIIFRIYDDGSHSVNRTKVFIYDVGLMLNDITNKRHPLLLIHDNIFDVDQDTLVQCLNYLYEKELSDNSFQYVLTLNRDKIENEEKAEQIIMNIDSHVVARFTKEMKFLKQNYQEK